LVPTSSLAWIALRYKRRDEDEASSESGKPTKARAEKKGDDKLQAQTEDWKDPIPIPC